LVGGLGGFRTRSVWARGEVRRRRGARSWGVWGVLDGGGAGVGPGHTGVRWVRWGGVVGVCGGAWRSGWSVAGSGSLGSGGKCGGFGARGCRERWVDRWAGPERGGGGQRRRLGAWPGVGPWGAGLERRGSARVSVRVRWCLGRDRRGRPGVGRAAGWAKLTAWVCAGGPSVESVGGRWSGAVGGVRGGTCGALAGGGSGRVGGGGDIEVVR